MATLLVDDAFILASAFALVTSPWGLLLPREHAHGHVMAFAYLPIGGFIFPIKGFFFLKEGFVIKEGYLGKPMLALAACPLGLPLPLLLAYGRFLGFDCVPKLWIALPLVAALILAGCLCYGCFSIAVVITCTWACHGLGSVPMVVALALLACPLEGYFSK